MYMCIYSAHMYNIVQSLSLCIYTYNMNDIRILRTCIIIIISFFFLKHIYIYILVLSYN